MTGTQLARRDVLRLAAALGLAGAAAACGETPAPSAPTVSAILTASEFLIGTNRVPFTLVDSQLATIEGTSVRVRFSQVEGQQSTFRFDTDATFHRVDIATPHVHADGAVHQHTDVREFYTVDAADFDHPGFWTAEVDFTTPDGRTAQAGLALEVRADSGVPAVGDAVPPSRNPTARDVARLEDLTTVADPEPALYELSVAGALETRRPFVVAFSTPQFCVSRMCGPVTEVVTAVRPQFADRVDFLHIEPFDLGLARTEGQLAPVAVTQEWHLETEPWVFVVDAQGRVAARFEGLLAREELVAALSAVAGPPAAASA